MASARTSKVKKEKKKRDSDTLKALLAKHIQKIRKRKMTARQAATELGISRTALTQMETGTNHFNAVTLYRLAAILKCDIRELFPLVPDSTSLTEADAEEMKRENAKAAEFLKKAYPSK